MNYRVLLSIGLSVLLMGCIGAPGQTSTELPPSTVEQPSTNLNRPLRTTPSTLGSSTLGQRLPISAEVSMGGQTIQLEVARTPRQQAIGLMHRADLPDNRGMLFPFSPPRPVQFWMRNVQFPLDMIFVHNGEIRAIAPRVPPCTAVPCPTYGPEGAVDYVIELRGGRAEELGVSVGDRLSIQYLDVEAASSQQEPQ